MPTISTVAQGGAQRSSNTLRRGQAEALAPLACQPAQVLKNEAAIRVWLCSKKIRERRNESEHRKPSGV
jgi:hypothetical protein